MSVNAQRVSFAVPVTAGQYAPERIYIGYNPTSGVKGIFGPNSVVVEQTVASMVVELWVCKPAWTAGGPVDGDFILWNTLTTPNAGLATGGMFPYRQIRVKSGGTSGTAILIGG